MMAINPPFKFATELIEALGISDMSTEIDLHIGIDEPVTVTVKYLVEDTELDKLIPILKKYELKEKKEVTP